MQAMDFVRAAKAERDALALTYRAVNTASAVGELLAEAQLTEVQRQKVAIALDKPLLTPSTQYCWRSMARHQWEEYSRGIG